MSDTKLLLAPPMTNEEKQAVYAEQRRVWTLKIRQLYAVKAETGSYK